MRSSVNRIVKKKEKALGVFEKTKVALLKLADDLRAEKVQSEESIKSHKEAIASEENDIKFLDGELARVNSTVENINHITG